MDPQDDHIEQTLALELEDLRSRGLYRSVRRLDAAPGPRVTLAGRQVVVLGSNNYLGLTEHPAVRAAAEEATARWGTGATGSRLTTGGLAVYESLEEDLARFKGTEAALLFGCGYQAAVGTIPALAGRGDLILSDASNHACLIDGCRLSRADVRIYRHRDAAHAAELLRDRDQFRRCLVVTDGVFSMDGDLAPLPELCDLCDKTHAWLMVDDAHATGVLGAGGSGTVEHFGVTGRVPIQMGTLSKALASEGGFIAGSRTLVEYLRNRARTFIFATAPAPAPVAAARAALRVAQEEPDRRRRLQANIRLLREGLWRLGCDLPYELTPILPVLIGEAKAAVEVAEAMERAGIWAPAIRPPTVPPGSARLRVSVMATHSPEDLAAALTAFETVLSLTRQATAPGASFTTAR